MGQHYEDYALNYLQQRGLQLVEKNFNCRCGEIDLIMRDSDTLVFVEVKYRNSTQYGNGIEQVTRSKRTKLVNSALLYLARHSRSANPPCRFDVVGIGPEAGDDAVQWVKNAIDGA